MDNKLIGITPQLHISWGCHQRINNIYPSDDIRNNQHCHHAYSFELSLLNEKVST